MTKRDEITNQHDRAERDTTKATFAHVADNLHADAYSRQHHGAEAAPPVGDPPRVRPELPAGNPSKMPPEAAAPAGNPQKMGPDAVAQGTRPMPGDPPAGGGGAPDAFDAKAEARKIEDLAKTRLDTGDNGTGRKSAEEIAASKALTNEWASLSAQQRTEVGAQLTKDYNNHSVDTLPKPTILTDANGKVLGLQFEASAWDFHSGPHALRLVDDGKKLTERVNVSKGSSKWDAEYAVSR